MANRRAIRSPPTALAGTELATQAETRHVAVVGVTGTGKSVAIRGLLQTTTARGDRHVVADPDGGAMALFHQAGDVILNPADARSAKWDLLAAIEEDSDYRLLAERSCLFVRAFSCRSGQRMGELCSRGVRQLPGDLAPERARLL